MTQTPAILKRLKLKQFPQPDLIRTRYPVFLAHGFGAVGTLVKPSPLHDPCMLMREHGVQAIAPNVVPYASIETRASNWVKLISEFCERYDFEKVNVVAHSMGGLDIRYALAHLDISDKVASLTTVASPHRGTFLADLVLKTPEKIFEKIGEVADWLGEIIYPEEKSDAVGSVEQLTRKYVQEVFNPSTPDPDDVPIFSYSAAVGKNTGKSLNPVFLFQNTQIYEKEGINDSFVSVESAKWGEHLGTVKLSHLNQINVQVSRENRPVYRSFWTGVAQTLAERGF